MFKSRLCFTFKYRDAWFWRLLEGLEGLPQGTRGSQGSLDLAEYTGFLYSISINSQLNIVDTMETLYKLTQYIRQCTLITKIVCMFFYTSLFFHKESGWLKLNLFVCPDGVISLFKNRPRICLVFHVFTTRKCLNF